MERIDPVLLAMSRDYVGDMAETLSLLWPAPDGEPPDLDDGTVRLSMRGRAAQAHEPDGCAGELARMLDHLDISPLRFDQARDRGAAGRHFGAARQAGLADAFGLDVEAVEEVWHGLKPPYAELFDWAEGLGPQPSAEDTALFRPFMLAQPLEDLGSTTTTPPNGNGTASASRSPMPAAKPASTAAPATIFP